MDCLLRSPLGPVRVVLLAGWFTRRIVCWARPDDMLLRGQRFAVIKLGSRVDLYLPATSKILVSEGTRVVAGITPVAILAAPPTWPSPGSGH